MVEEAKRTIAYLCPECRQAVVAEKTVFSLCLLYTSDAADE